MLKQGGPQHLMPLERIESKILLLRGEKVLQSTHLAELYEVGPRALVQAVKRNLDRFPADFMFQLSADEFRDLKSQIVSSSWGGLRRAAPYAFTEQGVAMLSSVLKSKRAIQVTVAIMRAFVRLRANSGHAQRLGGEVPELGTASGQAHCRHQVDFPDHPAAPRTRSGAPQAPHWISGIRKLNRTIPACGRRARVDTVRV